MDRLTCERLNGIKTGFWSPEKKEDLINALAAYENTGLDPQQIKDMQFLLREKSRECGQLRNDIRELEDRLRWISVEERLPAEGETVLVWYEYFRYGKRNRMYQTYGIGYQIDGNWGGDVSGVNARCIAWMPLPESYRSYKRRGDDA